ncbi:hypothetical protein RSP797_01300 [Ralstonia solanacearum]|nr:hypothetical protein RSP797_01300 [Ralstonia solanacearum]
MKKPALWVICFPEGAERIAGLLEYLPARYPPLVFDSLELTRITCCIERAILSETVYGVRLIGTREVIQLKNQCAHE